MLKSRIFALVIFVGLAGCTTPAKADKAFTLSTYQAQQVTWADCPDSYFVPSDQQSSVFVKSSVQCGSVTVPAEYTSGYSLPDFKIAMMREPATGTDKLGTLFINPGGPGESGVEELQWLNFPSEIRAQYDIIGFDPRGVSRSAPVSGHQIKCSNQSDFETYWRGEQTPANDAQYLANVDAMDAYYRKCAKDNPNWWTLNTSNVVDDLDLMRSVITGSEPLNFLGSSYGTSIAAQYITAYPEHVGHIALDSPTTNEPTKDSTTITQAKTLEANVMRLVKGYAKAKHMSVAAVKQLMLKVRLDGDNDKLRGFAGMKVLDAKNQIHLSTEYMFTHGIQTLTYYDLATAQKYFNQGLDEVSGRQKWNGTFEYFGLEMDGYDTNSLGGSSYQPNKIERNNSFEIMTIVDSMDIDYSTKTSKAHDKKLAAKIKLVSPFWTALTSDASNYQYQGKRRGIDWDSLAKSDPNIPNPPTKQPVRTNTSGKQVLVVGARYESTTPYAFAQQTASDLRSPLVTFNGTGHSPLAGFDKTCLNAIFIDYFINNHLPSGPVTCTK